MYLPADSSELFFIYDHSGWGEGNSLINLRSINLSKANTANVTKMNKMFLNCSSLKTLDLSGFDTSNVTDMSLMFMYCKSLETLDLSGFDTSGVTGMEYMFSGCRSLRVLDVSGFDTSNVRSVASMFTDCSGLQVLDLSSFDLSGLTGDDNDSPAFDEQNYSMLYDCEAYTILTPVSVQIKIDLPYTFTDASGTEYNALPQGLSESIRITRKGAEIPEKTVIIQSANVVFQGKILLKFTFSFPESVLADEGAYVTFEKAGMTTKNLVSEGSTGGDSVSFTVPVPAPEYADDIVVRVYDGEGNQLTLKSAKGTDYTADGFAYSVKTYAENKSHSGSTEEMRELAKALVDYGTAAQIYFQCGNVSNLSVDGEVSAVSINDLAPYALITGGTKPDGVTGGGIMVKFDTDNTLRITFRTDGSKPIDGYDFFLDGIKTTPTITGNNAYLQVRNITAPNLDTSHSFSVTDGINTYTVTAFALSYAYTSVKNGNSARQNLGKALYLYNRAADAYFGS